MPDMEKVINIYANCILNDEQCCSDCYTGGPGLGIACRQKVLIDALYLLNEQQREIKILKAMGLKMPEITMLTDKPIYKVDT